MRIKSGAKSLYPRRILRYTACHITVPKKGRRRQRLMQQNVPISERFFDNRDTSGRGRRAPIQREGRRARKLQPQEDEHGL
jgi:hypothetical protein